VTHKPLIVLLFGPPGSGKGTQAAFIADRFGIAAISTGELFRSECSAGSRLGKLACSILASGHLVPDEVVNEMLAGVLAQPRCREGFLLDGYPRTVAQAEFLSVLLQRRGLPEPIVLHLDVPASKLVPRLSARRQCQACGRIYNLVSQPPIKPGLCDMDGAELICREDDQPHVISERLAAYAELTGPVIEHFAVSSYHRLDGSLAPAAIARQIESIVEAVAPVAV
jgi:adenylate kinase